MSMGVGHFAFGAAMTTLVVTLLVPRVRYPRTVVLAGGVWAMLPDAHWVTPVARAWLHRLHGTSPWVDLFWAHRTLDRVDPTDSKGVAAALVGLFLVTTAFAEWRSYRTPAPVEAVYEAYLDEEPAE